MGKIVSGNKGEGKEKAMIWNFEEKQSPLFLSTEASVSVM